MAKHNPTADTVENLAEQQEDTNTSMIDYMQVINSPTPVNTRFLPQTEGVLNTPPTDEAVDKLQGFSYLKSHAAIRAANTAFGPGGWRTRIVWREQVKLPKGTQYQFGVEVSVQRPDGTWISHEDVGTGYAMSDTDKSHNTAIKDAKSDGEKRALRHFGDAFGLGLYSNAEHTHDPQEDDDAPQQQNYQPRQAPNSNDGDELDLHCSVPGCGKSMGPVTFRDGKTLSAEAMGKASLKNHKRMYCNDHYQEANKVKAANTRG